MSNNFAYATLLDEPTPDEPEDDGITLHDILLASEATYRQIDYWRRTGIITAPTHGSGHPVVWTEINLTEAHLAGRWTRCGGSLQTWRQVLDVWRRRGEPTPAILGLRDGHPFVTFDAHEVTRHLRSGDAIVAVSTESGETLRA